MPICGVHLSDTFSYFYALVRRGFEPFGVLALTDSGIMILALLIYPTRNTFRYFYSLVRRASEVLGVSAQTDSVIRILALLIYLPEVIVPICGVHLSDTFRYFYSLVRRGSELFGVSSKTDSGIRILTLLIYPTRSYCAYLWCAPL